MRKKVINFWKTVIPLNFKVRVHALPESCCYNNIEVVNFDKVKDKFTEIVHIGEGNKLKSVDAIKIHKKNDLCLTEFKGHGGQGNKLSFTKDKINETIPKIVDSVCVLIAILGYFKAKRKWYYTILHPKELKITPYLVLNYEAKDLIPIKLALQAELNFRISARIETPIHLINCEDFERIFS